MNERYATEREEEGSGSNKRANDRKQEYHHPYY